MAEYKTDGLISSMSTTMTELQTPVDFENFFLNLLRRRSINELFPDPGGPMIIE